MDPDCIQDRAGGVALTGNPEYCDQVFVVVLRDDFHSRRFLDGIAQEGREDRRATAFRKLREVTNLPLIDEWMVTLNGAPIYAEGAHYHAVQ